MSNAQDQYHPDEWATRVQLAAAYRIFDMLGWTEMIYNHITVRLPDSVTGGERQFLINPFGLSGYDYGQNKLHAEGTTYAVAFGAESEPVTRPGNLPFFP